MPTMTLRLKEDTSQSLEALAKATERSKSFIAVRAIEEYISLNLWQVEAIRRGVADADAGELVEHAAVRKRWEAKIARSLD
jgi:RHH-type rel operon transcriptional repressor/antitoxin RelB